MKKIYLLFFALFLSFSCVNADFSIFARGHKIGTYEVSKTGNSYFTSSHLSLDILGFRKTIIDSSHAILNKDYSLKSFDYVHYENGKRRELRGRRTGGKIIITGDGIDTLNVGNRRVFTDIGIEMVLPKIRKPDSIDILSSGMWQIKSMYVHTSGDTIIVSNNGAEFKYVYENGKFKSMEGPGGLYIGHKKGNLFGKDIINSYRIRATGKRISDKRLYRRIVIRPPATYKFPEVKGFQRYTRGGFVIEPTLCRGINNRSVLMASTEYYNYKNSLFKHILKRLKGKTPVEIAIYVRDIMRGVPNMYPERASEILKARSGDCTEYASLCTTLLRGEGYPAYNVYGLVYMGGYYYYHAWVRVYTSEGWRCVDPTRGEYCDAKYIILQSDKRGGFSADVNFLSVKSLKIIDVR